MKKLPDHFPYLKDMYDDEYFPNFLVDKLAGIIKESVAFIQEGDHSKDEIQQQLDKSIMKINDMQDEFEDNDSDIETGARESIAETIEQILAYFDIDIDTEEAIRARDW